MAEKFKFEDINEEETEDRDQTNYKPEQMEHVDDLLKLISEKKEMWSQKLEMIRGGSEKSPRAEEESQRRELEPLDKAKTSEEEEKKCLEKISQYEQYEERVNQGDAANVMEEIWKNEPFSKKHPVHMPLSYGASNFVSADTEASIYKDRLKRIKKGFKEKN